ncbi:MAG: hypothetical protein JO204_13660 [Alphaproteobacteria bacterium]|nr:hypothetical protein [Alphaproteobacteria bacterium]
MFKPFMLRGDDHHTGDHHPGSDPGPPGPGVAISPGELRSPDQVNPGYRTQNLSGKMTQRPSIALVLRRSSVIRGMHPLSRYTGIEKVALALLEQDGIAVIWLLHVTAAHAYSAGHSRAAQILIDTADAAEQVWSERVSGDPTARR